MPSFLLCVYVCEVLLVASHWHRYQILCDRNVLLQVLKGSCTSRLYVVDSPKGRPGMSNVSLLSGFSGLSFDFLFLSPLLFFCLVLLLFLLMVPFSHFPPEMYPERVYT